MTWHASLQLDYKRDASSTAPRTVAHFRHDGPLRILQSLYPEGDAICHNVLVHPPGGLVGGDTLDIRVSVGENAHGLVTTPGATRFYRSEANLAAQRVQVDMAAGSRLEWLPLEALAYNDCKALNHATFKLAPGAELIGWDVTAFGLPNAQQPYLRGRFQQHLEIPGVWLERGLVDATDASLMDGPLGMAGHRCLATLFFATGTPLTRERRELVLEAARHVMDAHGLRDTAGATSPHDQVIAVRVLAPVVEPAMDLLRQVWRAWRRELWQLDGEQPRIWST